MVPSRIPLAAASLAPRCPMCCAILTPGHPYLWRPASHHTTRIQMHLPPFTVTEIVDKIFKNHSAFEMIWPWVPHFIDSA